LVYTTTWRNLVPTTISSSITTWAPSTVIITASDFYCPTPYVAYYRGGCYLPAEASSKIAADTRTTGDRTVYVLAESTTTTTGEPIVTRTSGEVVLIGPTSAAGSGPVTVRTSAVGTSSMVAATMSASSAGGAPTAAASTVTVNNPGNGAGDGRAGSGVAMGVGFMAVAVGVVLVL